MLNTFDNQNNMPLRYACQPQADRNKASSADLLFNGQGAGRVSGTLTFHNRDLRIPPSPAAAFRFHAAREEIVDARQGATLIERRYSHGQSLSER